MAKWIEDETPKEPGFYVVWMVADDGDGRFDEWPVVGKWNGTRWDTGNSRHEWWSVCYQSAFEAVKAKSTVPDKQ